MTSATRRAAQFVLGAVVFAAGIAAGSLHARSAPVQNRFGLPRTVLHVVVYKFKDNVSNYDREKAISGIKDMAAKIPGIKNVWLKTSRTRSRTSAVSTRSNSRAPRPPPITPRVPFMRRGPRRGSSSAKTVFLSRFQIPEHFAGSSFAHDSVSSANQAIRRAIRQQPLGPFRECSERGYAVTGLWPRLLNGFQHDARAVFRRGFGLCPRARRASQIGRINLGVRSAFEFFLVRLRQVHGRILNVGHDVAGLDENGVDAERIEFVAQCVA